MPALSTAAVRRQDSPLPPGAATSPDLFKPDGYLGRNGAARDGIEIHEVPGRHGEHPNEPNVRVLAEKLRACIAVVETASCKT